MAFFFAFALAFLLAEGRRVQPTTVGQLSSDGIRTAEQSDQMYHLGQNGQAAQSVSNISADVAMTSTASTAGISPASRAPASGQRTFEHFSHNSSMFEKHAFTTQYSNMDKANSLAKIKIILASTVGLGMLICCGCGLVYRIASLQERNSRIQYLHNGRVVYEWCQTPKVAMIYIRPPSNLQKTDLDIRIAAKHLRVGRKGKPSFLSEETFDFVNTEMSSWSFEAGELHILLKKMKKSDWPAVLLHGNRSRAESEKSGGLASSAFLARAPSEPSETEA